MDNKLVVLVLVFFLAIGAFSLTLFTSSSARQIKAANRVPVQAQSLCFASPLSIKQGTNATVTCVARDKDTNAVAGARCCFAATSGTLAQECGQTDSNGIFQTLLTATSDSSVTCTLNGALQAGSVSIGVTRE